MIVLASVMSFLLLAVCCYQIIRSADAPDERKNRTSAVLFGSVAVSLGIGCIAGSTSADMMMLEILPALAMMLIWESSFVERKKIRPLVYALSALYLVPTVFHIAMATGRASEPSEKLILAACIPLVLLPAVFFIIGICRRLRSVKMVMKAGTIWAYVSLAVEAVYILLYLLLSLLYLSSSLICPAGWRGVLAAFPFLAGLMLAALGIRDADDVLCVLWRAQERRIVEAMKVTKVETAMDPLSIEDVYQDIYERVVAYFETEKPFLDNELTINDLSKVLYSNKLYISRAISRFTGRNFCQFVNYYRVTYSMELFRNNHDLKIHELACGAGFNSDVSYNMAFRLFMGETPGEWCKKERNRKIKMQK